MSVDVPWSALTPTTVVAITSLGPLPGGFCLDGGLITVGRPCPGSRRACLGTGPGVPADHTWARPGGTRPASTESSRGRLGE